jgi:hypothetical protein
MNRTIYNLYKATNSQRLIPGNTTTLARYLIAFILFLLAEIKNIPLNKYFI